MTNYTKTMREALESMYISEDNVGILRDIVKRKSAMPLKFADGKMKVDLFTASAVTQVLDKVNPANKTKLTKMINTGKKGSFIKIAQVVMKSENDPEVEEENEGFASDAQRRAAFASGYKEKGKKKKEEVEIEEGKYLKYSDLLLKKARLIDKKGPDSSEVKEVNKEIKAEMKRLGIKEEVDLDEKKANFLRLTFNSPADVKKARKWMDQNLPGADQGFTGVDYRAKDIEFEGVDDAEDLMKKLKNARFKFKVDHREENELDEHHQKDENGNTIPHDEKVELDENKLLDALKKKLSDEGGAAGFKDLEDTAKKMDVDLTPDMLKKMSGIKQHRDGDYILEEAELDEAMLIGRDYEYDEKEGVVKISKKNFRKVKKDYKGTIDQKNKPTMMVLTKKGTSLVPVKFTEEVEESYEYGTDEYAKHTRDVTPGQGKEVDEASARRDAMRAMGKRRGVDPADKDNVATDDDRKAADKNIIMQLRKATNLGGKYEVEFKDKKKQKVSPAIAMAFIKKYEKMKPTDKAKLQDKGSKSYRDLLKSLKEEDTSLLSRIHKKLKEIKNG